ncbi:peptide/nickel transport system ATP-binding protein [Actinopolymorpha cephalotaxi]|uniref:Oligopeptide/dipeptide ABC transporter ATP-binding protein n=1 Tax=Actinopolymorpha cephalotaxi TaxID=504797 RepID=A0A1I2WZG0_9ACTN|nr:ABC transporter ATP-binding protein [Actinopolymorpha cephalotaxi]NYH85214.1 oligopeptide/dipeptide ABC transporter ATP-binding protein [Actinopolymorpha cephalotaxi]SFH06582.1 peptide/nickel transport system ATP-binding protein [Actinopolymorpha cephalotaxi]
MSLLEVDHLTHRYATTKDRPVLHDVNLAVEPDEVVALVGESGCGKTTLGKIIAGLTQPSDGVVRYEDQDIGSLRGKARSAWRRDVQMVHQDPYSSLNPGLSIGTTLGYGLRRHGLATHRTVEKRLLETLQQVGLDATPAFLHRYPHQLSGGQRQRVAIARAISLEPRLVVADEVTSMLDVSMRVAILNLLLKFRAERQISFVFISHDFGVVRYFTRGGRILVMFYGVVVEEGPTEQVITQPRHPYTYHLLRAIPVPDPDVAEVRRDEEVAHRLEGEPARTGCVFANRCPFAEDRCREAPPLAEVAPGHRAACFFPDRVPPITELTSTER